MNNGRGVAVHTRDQDGPVQDYPISQRGDHRLAAAGIHSVIDEDNIARTGSSDSVLDRRRGRGPRGIRRGRVCAGGICAMDDQLRHLAGGRAKCVADHELVSAGVWRIERAHHQVGSPRS